MGSCSSKSGHPGEDFVWSVLSNMKLHKLSYQEVKNIIFKGNLENNNYTVDTGYPITKEEALHLIKNLYDENNNKNVSFHRTVLKMLIEDEFKSLNKEKINSNNLLFIFFGLIKHPNLYNQEDSIKERIDNFLCTIKNLEETSTITNYDIFKKCLKKYLIICTKSITKAVLEEAINRNSPFKIQEGLKDLIDNVYNEKFIEDYLTGKLRNFESQYLGTSSINEMTNESLGQIFGDSTNITFLYIFDLRNDFVQTYSLV